MGLGAYLAARADAEHDGSAREEGETFALTIARSDIAGGLVPLAPYFVLRRMRRLRSFRRS